MTRQHLGLLAAAPTTAGRVIHRLGIHVHLGHRAVMEVVCPRRDCSAPAGQACHGVTLLHHARLRGWKRLQRGGAA